MEYADISRVINATDLIDWYWRRDMVRPANLIRAVLRSRTSSATTRPLADRRRIALPCHLPVGLEA
jgi:hypothetical protein